jgi:hypothetical protein
MTMIVKLTISTISMVQQKLALLWVFDQIWYTIGFHMIYAIFYLSYEDLDREANVIYKDLFGFLGQAHPKKLLMHYARLMRENDLVPTFAFRDPAVLNIKATQKELNRILRAKK